MQHVSDYQLQEYLDKRSNARNSQVISDHLAGCSICSHRLQMLSQLDHSLKRTPLERVPVHFTANVMKMLDLKETPSFLWKVLTNLAPLLSITVILVIVVGVLQATGVLDNPEISSKVQTTQTIYNTTISEITNTSKKMNDLLTGLFPFKFSGDGEAFTIFLLCFFSAIALMDKFVFTQLVRKR